MKTEKSYSILHNLGYELMDDYSYTLRPFQEVIESNSIILLAVAAQQVILFDPYCVIMPVSFFRNFDKINLELKTKGQTK